jgi:hypothetical protein
VAASTSAGFWCMRGDNTTASGEGKSCTGRGMGISLRRSARLYDSPPVLAVLAAVAEHKFTLHTACHTYQNKSLATTSQLLNPAHVCISRLGSEGSFEVRRPRR